MTLLTTILVASLLTCVSAASFVCAMVLRYREKHPRPAATARHAVAQAELHAVVH